MKKFFCKIIKKENNIKYLDKEETVLYIMILAASCDSEWHHSESNRIYELIKNHPFFSNLDINNVKEMALSIIDGREEHDKLITFKKDILSDTEKYMCFSLVLSIISADGKVNREEINFIDLLSKELDIQGSKFEKFTSSFVALFGYESYNKLKESI